MSFYGIYIPSNNGESNRTNGKFYKSLFFIHYHYYLHFAYIYS